ncbi:carboxymuconolactone decarboxylase family protein [Lichenibacterium minor]|uniref:Carboxymuconolactone decarboxylase family protein n=1 Tax=Lichenibacterium minor TaxID=2316528 RepID=A0A4Q2U1E8_9HYPH|nr:carboxymuconolactone decarboxylase family protein [Lichenibacterium minor]RYC30273.1 carboxymuconolactone decarboxylase family protein [Lichenibacterium minor]
MRIRDLLPDEMSEAQRRVAEAAASGKRGRVPAPLRAWLHSPELGDRAQRLGEFLRYDTSLGPRLSELAILVTARAWTSHYEWFAHKREALKAGIDPAVIAAIAERRPPDLSDAASRAVYDYAIMLHRDHGVSDQVHAAAVAALGEAGTVELVGLLGYYTLVAMTLNAFGIGLPDGETTELRP